MNTRELGSILNEVDSGRCDATLVSVIVPVYNTPVRVLRRAVESILVQTHGNLELLLVDDGSDAWCKEALGDICGKDSRIRLLHGGHHGVSHARNIALDAAKGDWISFADADDVVEPDFLADALAVAFARDVDFVIGSVVNVFPGRKAGDDSGCGAVHYFDDSSSLTSAARQMLGPMKCRHFIGPNYRGRGPVAKLYKASLAKINSFDESITNAEDVLYNYFFIKDCSSIAIVEKTWYRYFQYKGSAAHALNAEKRDRSAAALLGSMRGEGEMPEFLTRTAYFAFEGVAAHIDAEGAWRARPLAVDHLRHFSKFGCFEPPVMEGFACSPWFRTMVWLCHVKWFNLAFFFWLLKVKVANVAKGRRGLFDMNSMGED